MSCEKCRLKDIRIDALKQQVEGLKASQGYWRGCYIKTMKEGLTGITKCGIVSVNPKGRE